MYTHDPFPEKVEINVHRSNFIQGSDAKLEKNCGL